MHKRPALPTEPENTEQPRGAGALDANVRHCEICGAEAHEDKENCAFFCSVHPNHFCSQWDMIWIDWKIELE